MNTHTHTHTEAEVASVLNLNAQPLSPAVSRPTFPTVCGHNKTTLLLCVCCSCVFDLPFFFCRGADRMRVLSNLLGFAFDKVEAKPRAVSLQLIDAKVLWSVVHAALQL